MAVSESHADTQKRISVGERFSYLLAVPLRRLARGVGRWPSAAEYCLRDSGQCARAKPLCVVRRQRNGCSRFLQNHRRDSACQIETLRTTTPPPWPLPTRLAFDIGPPAARPPLVRRRSE